MDFKYIAIVIAVIIIALIILFRRETLQVTYNGKNHNVIRYPYTCDGEKCSKTTIDLYRLTMDPNIYNSYNPPLDSRG